MSKEKRDAVSGESVSRAFYDIAQLLESADDSAARVVRVLERLRSLVPYERCAVLEAPRGREPRLLTPPGTSQAEEVALLAATTALLGGLTEGHGHESPSRERHLAVPLIGLDEVVGVLFVDGADGDYEDRHVRRLSVVASKLAAYFSMLRAYLGEAERARQLDEARHVAETANRAKDEFVALVSHELRTPLNTILAWVNALRSKDTRESDRTRAFEAIERSVRAEAKLIENLLDLSCIANATLRLDLRAVEPAKVIKAAIETLLPRALQKSIKLEVVLDESVTPLIADPRRLSQVVANLVANAIKFTPNGGRVEVRLERAGVLARIRVIDSGSGIRSEVLPNLFERFRQGDSSTTRAHGGLGVGLALVKDLVELHGGHVRAESPGETKGATFTVELPLGGAALDVPVGAEANEGNRHDERALAGISVLLVDDDRDIGEVLQFVLEGQGAVVTLAASAAEALAAIERSMPHVLLSDIAMPVETGYDLMRKIVARRGDGAPPAAALSSYAPGQNLDKALKAGFQMLLAKPVDSQVLISAVAALARTNENLLRAAKRRGLMRVTAKKKTRRSAAPKAGVPRATSRTARATPGSFPIVGVGASAGGLEAFRQLLGALPTDTGMAYVLVQHLDPHHESILAELLSEATQMEVSEVQGDVRVKPNRVYVIPPTKDMVLAGGMLKLVPRAARGAAHMPIDSFLRTLADVQGSQAIGVILSGMGSDGTLGLQAIEAEGGIALVQDPASAKNRDMPRSAIAAGGVDFVLPPEDIARELERLGRHPYLADRKGDAAASKPVGTKEDGKGNEEESVAAILALLLKASGTDFSAYKKTTLRRRIARRMAVSRIESLDEYATHLDGNVAEAKALYDDCLITVTSFFRDPQVFQALCEQVLPTLLKDRPPDEPLRLWVAGCATGEEVYSIAMCLLERTSALSRNPSLQIFATDLSETALAKARDGKYLVNIARDVSPARLRRFFTKVSGGYQISKAIREMCVFARHDFTSDPPFSRLDLVSCRNVLIYLEPRLQEVVFETFHYALRPNGFLLIGPAETASAAPLLFAPVDEKRRIYSRKVVAGRPRFRSVPRDRGQARTGTAEPSPKVADFSEVPREADRMLLARFGPAGVVVDERLRILEFRGDTAPFLEHGHGQASLNLERLLRKGLLMDLRMAVAEARRTDAPVRRAGLNVRYQAKLRSVAIEVAPIKGRATTQACLLILFDMEGGAVRADRRSSSPPVATGHAKDHEIARLGQGLAKTTEYMHTLVREHEVAVEELQTTNEEVVSSNEELQSLNEELQTAKEEIQSVNEELATLNQELGDRNADLALSNDAIQRALDGANALVDTVRQPLVILDGELRVEKANTAFYEAFETTTELTKGRLLSELGGGQWNSPRLSTALRDVLSSDIGVEDLEVEGEFPRLGLRTISLNARRLQPEHGTRARMLVAIEDRTELKQAERGREILLALEHEAREQAEAADQLKDQFVATVSHELRGPLTVISGWMNVLLGAGKNPDTATLAKALAAIGRGVTAQGRLISDLLDHSRIVTGKVELQRTPIDLLTIAATALVGVRAAAAAKDIDIELSGDRTTSVVLGDSDRMQQVLWNLFLNAVKFTPPRGSIEISIERVGEQVHIAVSDTGCGISAELLPHIFERFRQAEGSSNRSQPGLGLGLTLVRELVELHGGSVSAASPGKDRGSTFTVILPIPALLLPPPERDRDPDTLPPATWLEPPHDLLAGTKVLVVDDEADARDAVVCLLERYGARVRHAASVAEAMAALTSDVPDVLVSDLGMPGEDGYELIRRVRLLPADAGGRLPSLAVSAYATDEHRKKVMRTGFQKHLEKPVAPAELVAEVARLARGSSPVATS